MKKVQAGFTLIELMIVVAIIGILAAIAIPQYQNYIIKSQVTRVMGEVGNIKTAVDVCLNDGRTKVVNGAPGDNTECNLGVTTSNLMTGGDAGAVVGVGGVPKLDSLTLSNATTLTGNFGNNANVAVSGKKLTWTRDVAGSWACTTDADPKYRPSGCAVS
jgi:type IV pilus assembly protein PilA